jgi:hypothetical protein
MIFTHRALLQQHSTFPVKNKNTEGTVQDAPPVRFHFLQLADCYILLINQDDFVHTFDDD